VNAKEFDFTRRRIAYAHGLVGDPDTAATADKFSHLIGNVHATGSSATVNCALDPKALGKTKATQRDYK
jgi:hypothetical protein